MKSELQKTEPSGNAERNLPKLDLNAAGLGRDMSELSKVNIRKTGTTMGR
jgi:hypothetical protein